MSGLPRDEPPGAPEAVALPVSFNQELLWLIDRAAPGGTLYNVPRTRRLLGTLEVGALRSAFDALAARHEILRTTYAFRNEQPVQVIHPPSKVSLALVDLTGADEAGRTAQAERIVRDWSRRPFDLSREVPLRAGVVRLAAGEHILHVDTHHIASDGGSRDILWRELGELYGAACDGRPAQLAPLPIQYADYAVWEREHLAGERLAEHLAYWRAELGGVDFSLRLPMDFPFTDAPLEDAISRSLRLPPALAERLLTFARRHDATPYMTVLAAFQAVLHRYGGQPDVLVGSPVTGRDVSETEGLIGYFGSTVIQRGRFADDPSFDRLLEQVRGSTLLAHEHREVPFEKLVAELHAEGQRRTPLGALFTMLDGADAGRFGPLEMLPVGAELATTKCDLTLFMSQRERDLKLSLRVRANVWTGGRVEQFLRVLECFLEDAFDRPGEPVSRLALRDGAETYEAAALNPPGADLGPARTITALVDATVARFPSRAAVVAAGRTLTYAELGARANRLTGAVRAATASDDAPIGILLDASVESVVAMVGILRAGHPYLPLSTDAPPARLAQQLERAGTSLVVTSTAHRHALPARTAALYLDDDGPAGGAAQPWPSVAGRAVAAASPDDLAYVLFTSGSTGLPKGVAVTHRNLVHYTRAVSRVLADLGPGVAGDGFEVLAGWHFAAVGTLAADLGNTALFPALCAGGTVHLLSRESADPGDFAAYVAAHPIDVLKITPGHLKALLPEDPAALARSLPARWLVCGGETLDFALADAVLAAGGPRLLNHYGPTETTVGACTFTVTAEALAAARGAGARSVPIGSPLAGVRCEVLDAGGHRLPVGLSGELVVGGDGVARGYIGSSAETAERFISVPGFGRAYRTGDRVRLLRSGALEYLGRLDGQVKIRGYRVESGEVEAAVAACPNVRAAAVRSWGEGDELYLAAYVVPAAGAPLAGVPGAVREFAARVLPAYLLPRTVDVIASLPLDANGKVDRRALPQPAFLAPPPAPRVAPRTVTETAVLEIWAGAFGRPAGELGVEDDFLALGGHSLLAIRILGKIKRQLGVRVDLRALFDSATVAELAEVVDLQRRLAALEAMSDDDAALLLAASVERPFA